MGMYVRATSFNAYSAAMASGMITRLEKVVYRHVYENQGATGAVAQYEIADVYGDMNRSFGPRFATLVKRQLLYEAGKKIRASTGREVLAYRTTDNRPIALTTPPRPVRKVLDELIVKGIDPVLFRKQRLWLLKQEDTEESKGLIHFLDRIADEMAQDGELRQLLTEDE